MPVLPLVGSMIVVLPGLIRPCFSASLIMLTPMRHFTLPPGLKYSSLASTRAGAPSVTRFNWTSGVRPIVSDRSRNILPISGRSFRHVTLLGCLTYASLQHNKAMGAGKLGALPGENHLHANCMDP